ncbi:NADH dehydrogenase [Ammoniphilus oxalaticus]|uniref:NADH-quinone oxidoreductase subunit D n=1 Tax=Ammoniphilus oxalaticus TaxID=66863 RepID=A0A419SH00_9BACL|nr:NADH-quinone oxidoreductase subunit D [Ammoniphilus oxalaticus]RKD23074.1 NADH dehydrogenase [Ammoniphilus oxalaticus]
MAQLKTEEMILNMGPHHPSTHGVLRLILRLDGEIVRDLEPVIGYLHRGTEKLAEDLNYTQIIPYTDRMDYLAAMLSNYNLVHCVETALGLEIPERAEYIRIIVMELQRIASHLVSWGTYLLDLGATTPFLIAFKDRETILDFFNELSGARLTYNYMRVGGVKWDVPTGWIEKVTEFVQYMKKELDGYHQLATGNEIFLQRTVNVGVYSAEMATDYGLTGVMARCAGVDWDLRRDEPYSIYDRFEFDVPVSNDGDCFSRYMLRLLEIEQSLRILEQALEQFPKEGDILAKVPRVIRPPAGECYTRIESSKGELGTYIYSEGRDKPYRLKFRRPSFCNLQILRDISIGESIANVVAILASTDIVLGEVDA